MSEKLARDINKMNTMTIDPQTKGMPLLMDFTKYKNIEGLNLNILDEDVNFPVAVIRNSALKQNIAWMSQLLSESGALFAPHGKTTMSPELFEMQLDAGAWGITLATSQQVAVARKHGIKRILLANQLIGKQSIAYIISELAKDPDFDFYCLVDDIENAKFLNQALSQSGIDRPIQVLLELGFSNGRTGVRSMAKAKKLAQEIADLPKLSFRGVEGFEGLIPETKTRTRVENISNFLADIVDLVKWCDHKKLFATGDILLSAGGSSYYDLVLENFKNISLSKLHKVVTRSGCYITHDAVLYKNAFKDIQARSKSIKDMNSGLVPALEVWGYVLSRPESGKLIVNVGKRDLGHDDLPIVQAWCRPGSVEAKNRQMLALDANHRVTQLDDQHCHIKIPAGSPLESGDIVQFGISHPCLTFDKWRHIFVVDDSYTVIKGISTFF